MNEGKKMHWGQGRKTRKDEHRVRWGMWLVTDDVREEREGGVRGRGWGGGGGGGGGCGVGCEWCRDTVRVVKYITAQRFPYKFYWKKLVFAVSNAELHMILPYWFLSAKTSRPSASGTSREGGKDTTEIRIDVTPLVDVRQHGRKSRWSFTSSASAVFLVHKLRCDKCIN